MYEYAATVTRVVDGDTVELMVDMGLDTHRRLRRVRLDGINSPELATPEGVRAFQAMRAKCEGKAVIVQTVKAARSDEERIEKWGRYLVRLYLDGEFLNEWLVKSGYAVGNYTGGARTEAPAGAPPASTGGQVPPGEPAPGR